MCSKGDIVKASAVVFTKYINDETADHPSMAENIHAPKGGGVRKCLFRFKPGAPFTGIVLGRSYRATGWYGYQEYDCPAHLMEDKRHKVLLVQPLDGTDRYYEPWVCLEDDLEVVLDIQEAISTKAWLDMLEEQKCL